MKRNEIIFASVIEECRKHQLRLDYAYNKLAPKVSFRFSKLQDAIGQKLFKGLLQFLEEEIYNKPFLDIFNRLEQLDVIEDYELWNELRIIRNEIAHEYDENKNELIENLNKIINSKVKLEKYPNDVMNFIKKRGQDLMHKDVRIETKMQQNKIRAWIPQNIYNSKTLQLFIMVLGGKGLINTGTGIQKMQEMKFGGKRFLRGK